MKKTYGDRMVMVGGLDIQMYGRMNVIEDEIRKNIRDTFEILAPNGGFITMCAVAHSAYDDVINEEITKCSRYYYGHHPDLDQEIDLLNASIAVVKK